MDKTLKKSVRNGLIAWGLLSAFSFFFGGLYTEMYIEGLAPTLQNFFFAAVGAVIIGIFAFIVTLAISLAWFYVRGEKK